jgi:poly-gamma-glutamate capsule biosynthesis protein CapA/YwtB (metallophosphatase superfamily)
LAEQVILLACGDIGPIHGPVGQYATLAREQLAAADIRFGQIERVYSRRGALQLNYGGAHSRVDPDMANVFLDLGINVASLASNHAMDWGPEGLADTLALFQQMGITVIGAGRTLAEARRPAFIERNGVTIAFLAYCSILHEGYEATPSRPGVAPLRARTFYEPIDYQPGVPARIITIPYEEDLRALCEDVRAAREKADAVVLSLHWGVHFVPRLVADYQGVVARAAIAAGADAILGHHAHVPKAIEVIDSRVCFHSLSNFVMTAPARSAASAAAFEARYGVRLDPGYPNLPYGEDAKRSLVARLDIGQSGVRRAAFLPVMIDKKLRPEILRASDPRFVEMLTYMERVSEGFSHRFTVDNDEVQIEG